MLLRHAARLGAVVQNAPSDGRRENARTPAGSTRAASNSSEHKSVFPSRLSLALGTSTCLDQDGCGRSWLDKKCRTNIHRRDRWFNCGHVACKVKISVVIDRNLWYQGITKRGSSSEMQGLLRQDPLCIVRCSCRLLSLPTLGHYCSAGHSTTICKICPSLKSYMYVSYIRRKLYWLSRSTRRRFGP